MQQTSSKPGPLTFAIDDDGDRMTLEGALDIQTLAGAAKTLREWQTGPNSRVLAIGKLTDLDTPGALLLCDLRDKGVELAGGRDEHKALLDLIGGLELKPLPRLKPCPRWRRLLPQLGKGADD